MPKSKSSCSILRMLVDHKAQPGYEVFEKIGFDKVGMSEQSGVFFFIWICVSPRCL